MATTVPPRPLYWCVEIDSTAHPVTPPCYLTMNQSGELSANRSHALGHPPSATLPRQTLLKPIEEFGGSEYYLSDSLYSTLLL